jgi:methylenetetrahydrofolate reductase (NADPH)
MFRQAAQGLRELQPTFVPPVSRFEVLPLDRTEKEAARVTQPLSLTVTSSPKHGPDRSVEVARRLRALGHGVTVHLAARMVRSRSHLDDLLGDMSAHGMDVFLIGGDISSPLGPYESAVDLLPVICEHPQRPGRIGIAGYPEGHPRIDSDSLAEALEQKSGLADYITTQLCFDPEALLRWVDATRQRGVTLPVIVGIPGAVDRRRLLKISIRIGVGSSLSFLRKQHGVRHLFGHSTVTPDHIHDAIAPSLGDPARNIIGFHYYTFNQLEDTWRWERQKDDRTALAATP